MNNNEIKKEIANALEWVIQCNGKLEAAVLLRSGGEDDGYTHVFDHCDLEYSEEIWDILVEMVDEFVSGQGLMPASCGGRF